MMGHMALADVWLKCMIGHRATWSQLERINFSQVDSYNSTDFSVQGLTACTRFIRPTIPITKVLGKRNSDVHTMLDLL